MHQHPILFSLVCVLGLGLLLPAVIWVSGKNAVYANLSSVQHSPVAIVFGAGLTKENTPSDALMDRLTVASDLFHKNLVDYLLVSGDNRYETYNEPEVMKNTLIESFGIPEDAIFTDYAGRRTYDTCRRAHDLFGIEHAILISQGYHLPRALWTCHSLGIESVGVNATLQPYIKEGAFKIREIGAIYKAFIDLYLREPVYIDGEFIQDLDR